MKVLKRKIKKILLFFIKPFLPNKSVICDGPGFKIRIRSPRTSVIGRSIYLKGVWEPEMTKVVKTKIEEGWHILDVGADIGYYSLLFSLKSGSNGAVASFEPDPEPWPYLKENVSMFKYSNISLYDVALSDHYGHGMMKLGGRGQLYPDKEGYDKKTNTVKMVPLDDFWPNLSWKKLDLVKIDVEGAEISVLKGMENIINKYHPHLLIEIHPHQLREVFNSSAEEVMDFITKKFPYRLIPVDSKTLEIPQNSNITVWADWDDKNNNHF
jgi:FkbM family methyltransferase